MKIYIFSSLHTLRQNVDFHNSPFHIVCLVAKPLKRSEAKVDLIMIQTLLLFICKLLCYHAN